MDNSTLPGASATVYFRPPVRPAPTEVLTIACSSSSHSVVTVHPAVIEFTRATFDGVAQGRLQPPSITVTATEYYGNGEWAAHTL